MKKSNEICFEKKLGKYLFNKDINFKKREGISKSPTTTDTDSSKSNYNKKIHKKISPIKFDDNLFMPKVKDSNDPFLFESKINIDENPFLSNIKQNFHFTMKLENEKCSNNFMKISSRITINNKNNLESKINIDENNTNIFSDNFINTNILYNEDILNSYSESNNNFNLLKENIINNKIINQDIKEEIKNNNNSIINLSEKEKIIIEALISLDKDYNKNNEEKNENIDLDIEDYNFEKLYKINSNNNSPEEILEFEQKKNIYKFIYNRIIKYYNNYKNYKVYKLEENKYEINKFNIEINNILLFEQNNNKFIFFGFKSIVICLYILVIKWLSNSHFKRYLDKIKEQNISFDNNTNINFDIFIKLMDKYNTIKDICPFLEKDFKEIINNFQQNKKIKFCLCELLTDLYWDYLFKIHYINNIFTKGFTINNINKNIIFEESKNAMKSIIDILIVYNTPYKKNLGEILDLPYIKNENIFLMSYIINFKKNANPFVIKNPCLRESDENTNRENKENKENKEKINISNNKSSKENKNTENFSLDEVYQYIQGGTDIKKGKKKNKKRQKKKKNKNEDNINRENENISRTDPIVEEFIQNIIDFNEKNIKCIKIKPVISQEWIKSIS